MEDDSLVLVNANSNSNSNSRPQQQQLVYNNNKNNSNSNNRIGSDDEDTSRRRRRVEKLKSVVMKCAIAAAAAGSTSSSKSLLLKQCEEEKKKKKISRFIERQFEQQHFIIPLHPDHPPYAWMIENAIKQLNEDGVCSTEDAISNFILHSSSNNSNNNNQQHVHFVLPWAHPALLTHHLTYLTHIGNLLLHNNNTTTTSTSNHHAFYSIPPTPPTTTRKQTSSSNPPPPKPTPILTSGSTSTSTYTYTTNTSTSTPSSYTTTTTSSSSSPSTSTSTQTFNPSPAPNPTNTRKRQRTTTTNTCFTQHQFINHQNPTRGGIKIHPNTNYVRGRGRGRGRGRPRGRARGGYQTYAKPSKDKMMEAPAEEEEEQGYVDQQQNPNLFDVHTSTQTEQNTMMIIDIDSSVEHKFGIIRFNNNEQGIQQNQQPNEPTTTTGDDCSILSIIPWSHRQKLINKRGQQQGTRKLVSQNRAIRSNPKPPRVTTGSPCKKDFSDGRIEVHVGGLEPHEDDVLDDLIEEVYMELTEAPPPPIHNLLTIKDKEEADDQNLERQEERDQVQRNQDSVNAVECQPEPSNMEIEIDSQEHEYGNKDDLNEQLLRESKPDGPEIFMKPKNAECDQGCGTAGRIHTQIHVHEDIGGNEDEDEGVKGHKFTTGIEYESNNQSLMKDIQTGVSSPNEWECNDVEKNEGSGNDPVLDVMIERQLHPLPLKTILPLELDEPRNQESQCKKQQLDQPDIMIDQNQIEEWRFILVDSDRLSSVEEENNALVVFDEQNEKMEHEEWRFIIVDKTENNNERNACGKGEDESVKHVEVQNQQLEEVTSLCSEKEEVEIGEHQPIDESRGVNKEMVIFGENAAAENDQNTIIVLEEQQSEGGDREYVPDQRRKLRPRRCKDEQAANSSCYESVGSRLRKRKEMGGRRRSLRG